MWVSVVYVGGELGSLPHVMIRQHPKRVVGIDYYYVVHNNTYIKYLDGLV